MEAASQVRSSLKGQQLYSRIYYFHRDKSTVDADNLSKPLLDALKGVVYADDIQVVQRTVARIEIGSGTYSIGYKPDYLNQFNRLVEYLGTERHVPYIEIGTLENFNLILTAGPL